MRIRSHYHAKITTAPCNVRHLICNASIFVFKNNAFRDKNIFILYL
jgi:hypothetical protein